MVAWVVVSLAGLCACGSTGPRPLSAGDDDLLLLGEVHDNASGHAQRLAVLQRLVQQGARPALLMEQFDRELQPAIDRLLASPAAAGDALSLDSRTDALVALTALVATATGAQASAASGWDWSLYRPLLRLALQYRLRLVAVNVSRSDARAVIQQGLAARGFDAAVPADIAQAQAAEIERSHCGAVDAAMARRMAGAQVARDQFMAQRLQAYAAAATGAAAGAYAHTNAPAVAYADAPAAAATPAAGTVRAVLLAGNGHVRRDVGVPRWLPPALQARTRVIGFVEPGNTAPGAFDQAIEVPAAPRADPCLAMRQR